MTEDNNHNEDRSESQSESDTPDWLRSFKGCEQYSDEEAAVILHSLDLLAEILLTAACCTGSEEKAAIIPLYEDLNKKAA